jgi:uncharacterized protein with von Willebrand factor type A (vWA) domain
MESRILQLISALRASGVRISLAESAEAFSAVEILGIHERERFRQSLRATLVKDFRELPVFDRLFPLYFGLAQPPLIGDSVFAQLTPAEAALLADALSRWADHLADRLLRAATGKQLSRDELEALGKSVGLDQAVNPEYQDWWTRRMMRSLGSREVQQAIKALVAQLIARGMDPERIEQLAPLMHRNLDASREAVRQFVGERIADNLSQQPPAKALDGLLNRPFHALTDADKKALQAEVRRLAAALRTRIALRQTRARTGTLDPRATIRANLRYHGVPMQLRHRNRNRKPKLVLICDVSTSMRSCAEFMLAFLFALQGQVRKTSAFAYIDHLESISEDFRANDPDSAVASVLLRMPSGHYNTDLGWSLNDFSRRYMETLSAGTTLIILGDGRNNYNDPRVDLFARMARRAARTIWLNPEPPLLWHGDSDMPKYAPLCNDVLKVGNLRELAAAVDQLLTR